MWFYPSNPRVPYFTFISVNQKNSETSKSHSKFSGRIFEESKRGKKRFVLLCCSPQISKRSIELIPFLDKFDYFDSMSCFLDFGVSDWFLQISSSGELFIATRVLPFATVTPKQDRSQSSRPAKKGSFFGWQLGDVGAFDCVVLLEFLFGISKK